MLEYVLRRLWHMVWTLLLVSVLIFWVVNLPPGDYLSNQIAQLRASGEASSIAKAEFLMRQYGLDQPLWKQYLIWMGFWPGPNGFSGILQGDLGWSFELDAPVADIVGEALWMTISLNLFAILFVYLVALPLGTVAAVKANSAIDYIATFIGYIGLATPNFLLALILYHKGAHWLGLPVGGLVSKELADAPLTFEKIRDIATHMIVPIIVIGTSGMAAMVRRLRANLLDELAKPYVVTAYAKGLRPAAAIVKYPLRMALNPFVADIGNMLPSLVSGSVLVSLVMGLQTIGPILLGALRSQDYFLSGFILLFISALTLVGMLISDLLLAALDPRIRFSGRNA
ncbi:ABC transporter permease [Oceanicella actignis]|uniref:ABC transporter permease n=1 Tax=Oceanicella actignis TaxID=1189325 RepID=UPI0011E698D3|nr:ABC transporter permease [Oceanicella actignis]TYO85210.1 peptide/nickel transport system permease protein [Oceanicella actignis]